MNPNLGNQYICYGYKSDRVFEGKTFKHEGKRIHERISVDAPACQSEGKGGVVSGKNTNI